MQFTEATQAKSVIQDETREFIRHHLLLAADALEPLISENISDIVNAVKRIDRGASFLFVETIKKAAHFQLDIVCVREKEEAVLVAINNLSFLRGSEFRVGNIIVILRISSY